MLASMRLALFAPLSLTLIAACPSTPSAPSPPQAVDAGSVASEAATPKVLRPLPVIWGVPTLADENPDPDIVEVRLTAQRARASLDGVEIDVLAYNGTIPGPLLQARVGARVIVHFRNELGEPTTVHWHGLRIPENMDGSPRIQMPVPNGEGFTYEMVVPDASSFWYHPHVHTNDQLERGLQGPIVIHGLDDPEYDLERSLVLDDVLFDATGAIAPETLEGLVGLTGRWGKVMLTNGKNAKDAKATAKKGQVERWRVVNSANARRMLLEIEGARARVIGTDGGLLPEPFPMTRLTLPVGGRYDIEVTYDAPGTAKLVSVSPLVSGEERTTMLVVDVADGPDAPRTIDWPTVRLPIPERTPTSSFTMSFDFLQGASGLEWFVNGQSHWMEPILTVDQGATVKISLQNATGGVEHPFHMHGQFFRVLDSRWPGLRDTVQVPSTGPIEIVTYFDNPGRWMAHCHILEHAELGMMTEIQVTPRAGAPSPGHE